MVGVLFCTYRSPITRPIQELTRRRILEVKKTPASSPRCSRSRDYLNKTTSRLRVTSIKITTKNKVENQKLMTKKSRRCWLIFLLKRFMLKLAGKQSAGNLFHRATVLGKKLLAWNSFLATGTSRVYE